MIPEDWGGDTIFVNISAKFGKNIDELLDMILLQAEMMELKANPDQNAAGSVVEARLVIIKADVQGSVEALAQSLEKIKVDGVRVDIIHKAVGAISESDVTLAEASNAVIIGFNVRPTPLAKSMAESNNIDIRLHRVIYNAIEEVEDAMKGMLEPVYKEETVGQVEVRQIYKASKIGTIAGGMVIDGKITRDSKVRLIRDGVVVYEGELGSLKRFKDDVKEVKQGYECGLTIQNYNDIKEGDVIEAYQMKEVPVK